MPHFDLENIRKFDPEIAKAFDLEFNEIIREFKPRLELIIKQGGVNTDAFRLLE
ncbi:MAG: hypothetical protein HY753_05305, partial [Nitrospirae bacterium]|nr:hypothetical protein [Nitrospirota bacterium]